jgi:hypothetical protein
LLCIVKGWTGRPDCFARLLGRIGSAMGALRPPGRGTDPLGVLMMAAALVAAAIAGAALGFAIDFLTSGTNHSEKGAKEN